MNQTPNKKSSAGMSRVDGRAKVTGAARYSAEYNVKGLAYGVLVGSTIAKGSLKSVDIEKAKGAPGVLAVITHFNCPKVPGYEGTDPNAKGYFKVFHNDRILFHGQPIALVVADSFERALFAASLVKGQYAAEKHRTSLKDNKDKALPPHDDALYSRGIPDAWKTAPFKLEQEYTLPDEVHNPMELHAIVAQWDAADKITVWTKTQGVKDTQNKGYAKHHRKHF
jgi:xanthine dehydrogenase YagR molybdenum-binding subunit